MKFLVIYLLCSTLVYSYTLNETGRKKVVKWPTKDLSLSVNPASNSSLSETQIKQIISESVWQWDQSGSGINISERFSRSFSPERDVNDLYFSSESLYLGPSVAGVTVTSTNQNTGEIIESDIIINDGISISGSKNSNNYLGDIVSHELGHYLGLAHSEVQYASMFFRLTKGQHEVSHDDQAGARALYSGGDYSEIKGRIVGGASLFGVFGSHVQAISMKTGKVAASAISEADGSFYIKGLDHQDSYFLYVDKLKSPQTLPDRFSEVRSDFCYSGLAYRGSFFQSCHSQDEGYPQPMAFETARSLNVGDVTIRCGLDVPVDYILGKSNGSLNLTSRDEEFRAPKLGEALVGYFSSNQVEDREPDYFNMEVNINDLPVVSGNEEFYLEVKTINQPLRSALRLGLSVENGDFVEMKSQHTDALNYYEDGTVNIDNVLRFPLSLVDPTANSFDIEVTPDSLEDYADRIGKDLNLFISESDAFKDPLNFYFFVAHIVKKSGDDYLPVKLLKEDKLSSNKACPGAPKTYSVSSTKITSSNFSSSSSENRGADNLNALGCGMILLDQGKTPPGGGGGAVAVFLFVACFILTKSVTQLTQKSDFI